MTRRRILSALASLPALFLPRSWARASAVRPRMMSDLIEAQPRDNFALAQALSITGTLWHNGARWSGHVCPPPSDSRWFEIKVTSGGNTYAIRRTKDGRIEPIPYPNASEVPVPPADCRPVFGNAQSISFTVSPFRFS